MKKIAIAITACLALVLPAHAQPASKPTAAKPTTAQAQTNPLLVLQQFTVGDLQAALADAQAQTPPDTVAAGCYTALLALVQGGIASPLPASLGVFQAAQKARDAKALIANFQATNGPLAGLNTACAPLILDAQTTLMQLGIATGALAAKVGLTLPLAIP